MEGRVEGRRTSANSCDPCPGLHGGPFDTGVRLRRPDEDQDMALHHPAVQRAHPPQHPGHARESATVVTFFFFFLLTWKKQEDKKIGPV